MQEHSHYQTRPDERIPFVNKFIYGLGAFINNLLAAAIGGMVIVLNLGLAMNPALVGLLSAIPRLTDAITDPLMGYISDKTRSRWGRRRPYIFVGAIAAGIVFALLWQLPVGQSESYYFWFFLMGSFVFYLAYTVFATPWVALGYELTPDYHERTRLMGVQNFMGQMAYLVSPWFLWFMQYDKWFDSMLDGAAWLAMIIGAFTVCVGILPAIFLKEPNVDAVYAQQTAALNKQEKPVHGVRDFIHGFLTTIKFKPFLLLCGATFLVFNGFMMVASFQSYVIIYYVCGGDQALGAEYAGWSGTLGAISTFCVIVLISKMGVSWGKRKAFFLAISMSVVGYCLKWVCYNPAYPLLMLLPVPFISFGLGGLFTLMGSMIADVCDLDELETGERREGMYGSIFWWVVKLGMALALAAGGALLALTGFDVEAGAAQSEQTLVLMRAFDAFLPAACSLLAIWLIKQYPLSEGKAHDVRHALETKRKEDIRTSGLSVSLDYPSASA